MKAIAASGYGSFVVKTDGTLWVAGYNANGQLGLGDTANRSWLTLVSQLGNQAAAVAAGEYHTLALKTDGTLWATGWNTSGQLGLGHATSSKAFVQVPLPGVNVAAIAVGQKHTLLLGTDGTLWAAGANNYGQLGLGDTAGRTSFTKVEALGSSVAEVVAQRDHTIVRKADGSVWATGLNGHYQLGLGDTRSRTSFTQITDLGSSATQIGTGSFHTVVRKADGTVWVTGAGGSGQLGLGNTGTRMTFTFVP